MEKHFFWISRPDSVGGSCHSNDEDNFWLWYCLEGNVLLDLLICKAEVRQLLDLRLVLAEGIRTAAEGLLLQICHLLGSIKYHKLLCS